MKRGLLIHILLLLAACAPRPSNPPVRSADVRLGSKLTDSRVKMPKAPTGMAVSRMSAEEFDPLAARLLALDAKTFMPWLHPLFETRPRIETTFASSPYFQLFQKRFTEESQKALAQNIRDIRESERKIQTWFERHPVELTAAQTRTLEAAAAAGFGYIERFVSDLTDLRLHPILAQELRAELSSELKRLRDIVRRDLKKIQGTRSLRVTLETVRDLIHGEEVKLQPSTQKRLNDSIALGRSIDAIKDSSSALTAVIDIWLMLTPKKRTELIKPANESLYNFLSGRTQDDLLCLRNGTCESLWDTAMKRFFVFPGIDSFGVHKLKDLLNEKATNEAMDQVKEEVLSLIRGAPKQLTQMIRARIAARLEPVEQLQKRPASDLRDRWLTFEKARFSAKGSQLTWAPARLQIPLPGKSQKPRWEMDEAPPTPLRGSELQSVIGMAKSLPEDASWPQRAVLGAIASLSHSSMVGGASDGSDQLPLAKWTSTVEAAADFVGYLREARHFEITLGGISVQDLFPDFVHDSMQARVFPKDAMIAVTLSKLSDLLGRLTAKSSPLFLVDGDGNVTWYEDATGEPSAFIAGLSEITNGKRTRVISSESMARMILALARFIEVTNDPSLLRSPFLQEADAKGKTGAQKITEARAQLRVLLIGLANFLSSTMRTESWHILTRCTLGTVCYVDGNIRVLDQLLAIRAFTETARVLDIDLYNWAARDVYYAMNRKLWNEQTGFWGPEAPALTLVTEGLLALRSLQPHLPTESRAQALKIERSWMTWTRKVLGL